MKMKAIKRKIPLFVIKEMHNLSCLREHDLTLKIYSFSKNQKILKSEAKETDSRSQQNNSKVIKFSIQSNVSKW